MYGDDGELYKFEFPKTSKGEPNYKETCWIPTESEMMRILLTLGPQIMDMTSRVVCLKMSKRPMWECRLNEKLFECQSCFSKLLSPKYEVCILSIARLSISRLLLFELSIILALPMNLSVLTFNQTNKPTFNQ